MLDPFVNGRGNAGGAGSGGTSGARLCARPAGEPAADIALAYAEVLKAPPAEFRPALGRLGHGLRRQQQRERRSGRRFARCVRADLRLCRRHGLSHFAPTRRRRLCARRRRHQLGPVERARLGLQPSLPVRRLRHRTGSAAPISPGRLSFTNHWFTTNRTALGDQLKRELRRPELRRPRGRRLPLYPLPSLPRKRGRIRVGLGRDALCRRAIPGLLHAGLQRRPIPPAAVSDCPTPR